MLTIYAIAIFVLFGLFFPQIRVAGGEVYSTAPSELLFLTISAQQRSNITFFILFFLLQIIILCAIVFLPDTVRYGRQHLLHELAPVQVCFHVFVCVCCMYVHYVPA
jgi:hypothetical protein